MSIKRDENTEMKSVETMQNLKRSIVYVFITEKISCDSSALQVIFSVHQQAFFICCKYLID